jgi:hypothetical protein
MCTPTTYDSHPFPRLTGHAAEAVGTRPGVWLLTVRIADSGHQYKSSALFAASVCCGLTGGRSAPTKVPVTGVVVAGPAIGP